VLRPGALLEAAAPRGEFVLADGTGPVVLVSAGIGVTPVLAMLYALAGSHSERPVWWIHTARNREQHAFADESHALLAGLPDAHAYTFYTAAPPDPGPSDPAGGRAATDRSEGTAPHALRGRPTAQALRSLGVPADGDVYLCGPDAFMSAVNEALQDLGVRPEHIRTELFGALAPVNPGVAGGAEVAPHQPAGPPGDGPLVTFVRSGLSAPWSPQYASLLDLAEACDLRTRWSCRTGVCHTCVTLLMSGDVRYAPDPLEPPDPGSVLTCCSQPATDVAVDL
jgi:ferredoxin-NADP reductase